MSQLSDSRAPWPWDFSAGEHELLRYVSYVFCTVCTDGGKQKIQRAGQVQGADADDFVGINDLRLETFKVPWIWKLEREATLNQECSRMYPKCSRMFKNALGFLLFTLRHHRSGRFQVKSCLMRLLLSRCAGHVEVFGVLLRVSGNLRNVWWPWRRDFWSGNAQMQTSSHQNYQQVSNMLLKHTSWHQRNSKNLPGWH